MTARAAISVAISTRDRPAMLSRCLQSLSAGRALPTEVVVADQSSTSATRDLVAAVPATLPVRWMPGGEGGLADAQNIAFGEAKMPVVAVLDDDCVAKEDWLAVLDRTFDADEEVALVGGAVLPAPASDGRTLAVSSRAGLRRRAFDGKSPPWSIGSGNNFAMRREWFERIGGCDDRLGPGAPGRGAVDMDLFYRVLRAGGRAMHEPGAVVYHERATYRDRRARRWPYGYGIGALCGFRIRERDPYGLFLIGRWVMLRGRMLASGLLHGRGPVLGEEALVLGGTAAGLVYGLRAGARPAWSSDHDRMTPGGGRSRGKR